MAREREPAPIQGIEVQVVGAVPRPVAQELTAHVSWHLEVPCRLLGPPLAVDLPRIPDREQVDADRLLEAVEVRARTPGWVRVGVTALDIGNPIFTFFFGRARHHGRAAIVSLARLSPRFYGMEEDPELTIRRATMEVLHELGHVAGLLHCKDYRCIMRFVPNVEGIDNRGTRPCVDCAGELEFPLYRASSV
jgi:archaemetzincin